MELLVLITDKTSDDPYRDCQLLKRGDVIVAMPDGHAWGRAERDNPDWRIIQCPGLSEVEALSLCEPEPGDQMTNRMLQRRAFGLGLDAIIAAPQIDRVTLLAAKRRKEAVSDPALIGPVNERVIG